MAKNRFNGRFDMVKEPGKGIGFLILAVLFIGPGYANIISLAIGGAFAYGFIRKLMQRRLHGRYLQYCSVLGNRERVDIHEFAAVSGKDVNKTRSELLKMISKGWFGPKAYFDVTYDELVIPLPIKERAESWLDSALHILEELGGRESASNQTQYRQPYGVYRQQAEEKRAQASAAQRKKNTEPEKKTEATQTAEPTSKQTAKQPVSKQEELEKVLRELYELNEKIKDADVSRKIDRIGELTAGIYSAVIQSPDKETAVHKFMNYYLPTTLRLLKSYALLEGQSYQGENIKESRKKIEGILDTLIAAFEQLLDKLFRDDALDIDTDVQVLETTMASDGLSSLGRMQGL